MGDLSHFDDDGRSRMVDVGAKSATRRIARATGLVRMQPTTLELIRDGGHPKGDVFEVARLAGIMAAKRTPDLIPLCHPLPLESVRLDLEPAGDDHVLTKAFYLLKAFPGRWDGGQLWVEAQTEGGPEEGRKARRADGVSSILITSNDFASAWALDDRNRPLYPVVPGGEAQREMAFRAGVNIVMYALTGNYKADQVHAPELLKRLGQ